MKQRSLPMWKNPSYLQNSVGIFLFFCAYGIWWSFFRIWLKESVHLSATEVGQVYSANSLVALILLLVYGAVQDQLGIRRHLIIAVSTIAALIGPFVTFIYAPMLSTPGAVRFIGILVGAVVLSAGFIAGNSLVEAIGEKCSRKFNFVFGQTRAWGSLGYAIVALFAGVASTIHPLLIFWLGSFFAVGVLAICTFWIPQEQRELMHQEAGSTSQAATTPSLHDILGVLRMPEVWIIMAFMLFTNSFYNVFDQQMFPSYYVDQFSDSVVGTDTYAVINGVQVFLEAACMALAPIIMEKIGVRNSLLLGGFVMFARIGLVLLMGNNIYLLSADRMIHALQMPFTVLPTMRYFALHYNTKMSATLYLVGFQFASQGGQIIFSTPLGYLLDSTGSTTTFMVMTAITFIAFVYGLIIIKKDTQDVDGDPLKKHINKGMAAQMASSEQLD